MWGARIFQAEFTSGACVRLIRVLDRYVFIEAFGLFILGVTGFLGFLVVNKLFLEAPNILDPNKPGMAIVLDVLLDTPYFATMALPVAIMFATLMSMGRLAKDNELSALFTNGVSLYRLFIPYLVLSAMAVMLAFYTNEYLLTAAASKKQEIYDKYPRILEQNRGDPDPFISRLDRGDFITAGTFDKEQGRLTNVIYDDWNAENGGKLIVAPSAQTEDTSLILGMNVGAPAIVYMQSDEDQLYESYTREATERVDLGVDLKEQYTQMKTPQELTQTELAEQAKQKRERGENPAVDETDQHLRFSGPFASLAFALVAMPLSLRAPRDERLLGLILTFVLVLVYYTVYFISKMMGYNELLSPWLAAWMQNIIFAVLAFFIFVFSRK